MDMGRDSGFFAQGRHVFDDWQAKLPENLRGLEHECPGAAHADEIRLVLK
jgi:hypothetical protein